ncbi:hypothetical protein H9L13_07030 [Sphingomonas lutea]|uniref:Lipoprotein n=1 Tax=Sphingomonas lutea TaxID=1045317 RepID=A0A7G9SF58_9SPHN|nr:hypothetical protein [Sphingomonas lutea]QNN66483.1 hypothetical protein H9L13_07030 [Sphingomonas lutea]
MKNFAKIGLLAAAAFALPACSSLGAGESGFSSFAAVQVKRVSVGDGSLSVVAPRPWNRTRPLGYVDIRVVEDWTLNGPYLDGISFVSGLKNDRYLVYQRRTTSQQVPKFRSNMTPPEIAAMIESLFRVRGGAIEYRTLGIAPRPFLGTNGFQYDYEHLDTDELWRKGRAVGAVIDGRLYLILLDAARSHYYPATLPDFEAIVASAQLRRG